MSRLRHVVLLVVLAVSFMAVRAGIDDKSPTDDEFAHLTRGVALWQTGDPRLSYPHPPLANLLATVGVADRDGVFDVTRSRGWKTVRTATIGKAWVKHDYAGARGALLAARRNMTWIFMVGIAYVYFLAFRLAGFRVAVVASALVAFHPVFIGHARYVTTDLAAAVAITIAIGELARHVQGRSPWATWFGLPLSIGVALLTKHSAVLLAPIAVVVVFVNVVRRQPRTAAGLARRVRRASLHGLVCAAVALLLLNAGYGFRESGLTVAETLDHPEPASWISSRYRGQMLEEQTPLPRLPTAMPLPVPYAYLFGLGLIRAQNERGFPHAQFRGERRPHGHVAYFPTMVVTKTPLAVLLLLFAGALTAAVRRRLPAAGALVIAGAALGILGISMRSNLNMGVRHVLPVLWGMSLSAAFAFDGLYREVKRHALLVRVLLLAPISVVVVGLTAGPDHIGYFNALVGRKAGHEISAIGDDWGQDRAALAALVEERGLGKLYYDPQTSTRAVEARHLGIEFDRLGCNTKIGHRRWVALHATTYNNNRNECWNALRGLQPVFDINDHILVFWVK
ncbi:MAG: glycosyltransferase family 39 protein [Myxococcota bacterium]